MKKNSSLTKAAFQLHDGKRCGNNPQNSYGKDEKTKEWLKASLAASEIDPTRRGEITSLAEFARLSNENAGAQKGT